MTELSSMSKIASQFFSTPLTDLLNPSYNANVGPIDTVINNGHEYPVEFF